MVDQLHTLKPIPLRDLHKARAEVKDVIAEMVEGTPFEGLEKLFDVRVEEIEFLGMKTKLIIDPLIPPGCLGFVTEKDAVWITGLKEDE
jgi:hypothetical protein